MAVGGLVVDEHRRLRGHPDAVEGDLEDPGVGLEEPDVTGEHEVVHEGVEAEMDEQTPGVVTTVADQRGRNAGDAQAVQEVDRVLEDPGMCDQEPAVLGDQFTDQVIAGFDPASGQDAGHGLWTGPGSGHHVVDDLVEGGPEHLWGHTRDVGQPLIHAPEVDPQHGPVDVDQPGLGRVHARHDRTTLQRPQRLAWVGARH